MSLLLVLVAATHLPAQTPAIQQAEQYATEQLRGAPVDKNLPDYHLPAAELSKAQHLAAIHRTLHFAGEAWTLLQLVLLLHFGLIAAMQRRAERTSGNRWLRGSLFVFLFLGTITVLDLPLSIYGHHLSLHYGLSVQRWPSWAWDLTKLFALEWLGALLIGMLLLWTLRRLPRSWWFAFWLCTIAISLLGAYGTPAFAQLFFHYEPLAQSQPALVQRLETVVHRGGMQIPPDRMFLMHASSKYTTLNADVEGLGPTKRVVVWDTTLARMSPDQILFVFGHESGHYVLGHIVRDVILGAIGSLLVLLLGYAALQWAVRHMGPRWGVEHQATWGAAVVLVLLLTLVNTLSEPLTAAISRAQEHAADIYGQEAIHGLVADPQTTAQGAFDVLGANSLEVPNPPHWYELWTYDHPATGWRAAFAHAYNPWQPGATPTYFRRP